ncbi:TonB-dependent siderophore receptor [Acidovorax sp. Root217]|uniref:TonB-dependent siderophore receptor n=1 Tax=Acidovorax sp. Root217 TaxID=1736492 RepID=UPI00070BADCC|nr:TonB-dependent siderophore receptor [Acidovorax sp. Root217]KRC23928.1 TonB-dependent receptor [Acidovorax sp. Root217]
MPTAPRHAAARTPCSQPLFTLRPTAVLAAALAGAWLAAAALPVHAQAQQTAQASRSASYSIPAGPLEPALTSFAKASGVLLAYTPDLVRGRSSRGLQGNHTAPQALAALLVGTGLSAVVADNGTYTLRRAPTPAPASGAAAAAGSVTLSEVRVTAEAPRNDATTEGTGSYTARGPSSTATGLNLTLRETPQSVSVMTRQRMDDFKLETLTDVMEQTPGISTYRQGNATDFQARGSSVNLQTDGVRQLTSGWYYFTSTMYALDDMAEIDRIEVLKGSSGLVNGYGSAGATVNLVRKRPTAEFQAHVGTSVGSWNTLRSDVDVGGPLNASGSLRGRIVASVSDADSFRDHEKSNSQMLFGALEADIAPQTTVNGGFTWRRRELRGMGSTQPIQRYTSTGDTVSWLPRSFNPGAPWAGYQQDALNVFGSVEHRFAGDWSAKLQFSHQSVQMDDMLLGYLYDRSSVATAPYQGIDNRNWTVNLDVKGPIELFGRKHELLMGAGTARYRGEMQTSNSVRTPLTSVGLAYADGGAQIPTPDWSRYTYGANLFSRKQHYAYAAGRFHLAAPLKLITGVRITDYAQLDTTPFWWNYDLKEHGVVTPYAGLVYDVHPNVSLYGSTTNIFEAQSGQDEQGRALPPEKGVTYEVGAKGEFFDKRLNAAISHFWMKTDNTAEETGQLTPSGDMAYRTVTGATRRGWEIELSGEIASGWQAQGSFVTQSSSLTSASQHPKHQFKLGTTYRLGGSTLQGLTVGAATRWQSETSTRNDAATLAQKSYWLVDLMARYQVNRHLSVGANINNLFDKKYLSGVTNFSSLHYTWGAPRSFHLNMRHSF